MNFFLSSSYAIYCTLCISMLWSRCYYLNFPDRETSAKRESSFPSYKDWQSQDLNSGWSNSEVCDFFSIWSCFVAFIFAHTGLCMLYVPIFQERANSWLCYRVASTKLRRYWTGKSSGLGDIWKWDGVRQRWMAFNLAREMRIVLRKSWNFQFIIQGSWCRSGRVERLWHQGDPK